MGVGLEYNENLMSGLAESGGGNYYFIERPGTLASIIGKEFSRLSSLCAHGVRIELRPGRDVRIRDVIGYSWSMEGERCLIDAGDVYDEERRTIVVELEVAPGSGTCRLAEAELRYEPAEGVVYMPSSAVVEGAFTSDRTLVRKHRNDAVQATVDIARSTRSVDRAAKALDEGNLVEARRALSVAAEATRTSQVASGAGAASLQVQQQSMRIKEFDRMLNDSVMDGRRAKKAIQYQNYQQQKSR
jgi:Ca-activated chloride channel homolog